MTDDGRFLIITVKDGVVTADTTHPILQHWSILIQNLDEGQPLRGLIPTAHYGESYHEIALKRREAE